MLNSRPTDGQAVEDAIGYSARRKKKREKKAQRNGAAVQLLPRPQHVTSESTSSITVSDELVKVLFEALERDNVCTVASYKHNTHTHAHVTNLI